jgi:hypothetical protein
VSFDYGGKHLIDHEGEACFAELAILRILQKDGWDGVWVEVFGGPNFVRTMPLGWALKSEHVSIPADKEELLKKIWTTAKSAACFDVFAWKGGDLLFCEGKRAGRDKLTKPQHKFIEGALACGIPAEALLIVEWKLLE